MNNFTSNISTPVTEIITLKTETQLSAVGGIVQTAIEHYGDDIDGLVNYLGDLNRELVEKKCEGGRFLPDIIRGHHRKNYEGLEMNGDTKEKCDFIDLYSSEEAQKKIFEYQAAKELKLQAQKREQLRRQISQSVNQLLANTEDTKITTAAGLQSWSEQVLACFEKYKTIFSRIEEAGNNIHRSTDPDPRVAGLNDLATMVDARNEALNKSDELKPFFIEIGSLLDQIDTGFMPEIFRSEPRFGFNDDVKTKIATTTTNYPTIKKPKFLESFPVFLFRSVYEIPHKKRYEEVIKSLGHSFKLVVLEEFLKQQSLR